MKEAESSYWFTWLLLSESGFSKVSPKYSMSRCFCLKWVANHQLFTLQRAGAQKRERRVRKDGNQHLLHTHESHNRHAMKSLSKSQQAMYFCLILQMKTPKSGQHRLTKLTCRLACQWVVSLFWGSTLGHLLDMEWLHQEGCYRDGDMFRVKTLER